MGLPSSSFRRVQMRAYLPNVEQLSQLFRTIGTIVLQLVDSHLPLALVLLFERRRA